MRQAVMVAPGCIEFREISVPVVGPGQALVRVRRIGVCGSDVHVYHGRHPYTHYPVIQGHEFAGIVEAVGEGVENVWPGAKVTAMPQVVCGHCGPCRRGDYHICDDLKVQGFQAPGCAQELFLVNADQTVLLPDTMSFEQGAFVEPAAVAIHAVSRAGEIANKNVVVFGAGPIGNLVAQVARLKGANVLIADLSEFRLGIAQDCGLSTASSARTESFYAAVASSFGASGFSVAFDAAGAAATVATAIEMIEKGGTIIIVAVFGEKPHVDLGLVQDHELNLRGTLMYQRPDYLRAIEWIASGKLVTGPLDSHHFNFSNYSQAYQFIDRQRDQCLKVFIDL